MSNYRRHYVPGGTWFFTVNLQNQSDLLSVISIACVPPPQRLSVRSPSPSTRGLFPEHMHCIWTLPTGSDFSARWRDIKKTFSRSIEMRHLAAMILGAHHPVTKRTTGGA
jgi:putative transposase